MASLQVELLLALLTHRAQVGAEAGKVLAIWDCAEGWCEISGGYIRASDLDLSGLPDGDPRKPSGGGGDDGDGDDNGNVREVGQDTDLYDAREGARIGMLDGGSNVSTIGNCGEEWCELSNPKGWVWGGDLD